MLNSSLPGNLIEYSTLSSKRKNLTKYILSHEMLTIYIYICMYMYIQWSESCSVVYNFLWFHVWYSPWNSPGQNTGVGSLSLLQGIFSTLGSNPGLSHCRRILYQLSHQENPCVYMVRTVGHTPACPLPCCSAVPTGTTSRVPRTSWSPPASLVRGMQQPRPAQKRTSSTDSSC